MGTAPQTFELKWQNHEKNLKCAFDQLLQAQAFVDATLVCDDVSLKVHQVVLSAASPYLRRIFLNHPSGHPVIILQDLDEVGMRCLVNFIYSGEVRVPLERLHALLKCAQLLKIHGFIDACRRNDEDESGSIQQPATSDVDHDRPPEIMPDSNKHFVGLEQDSNESPELDDRIDSAGGTTLYGGESGNLIRRRTRRRPRRHSAESPLYSVAEYRASTDDCSITLIKPEPMSPEPPPPLIDIIERPEVTTESLRVDQWTGSELSVSEVMPDGGHGYDPETDMMDEMDHNEGSTCSQSRRHFPPDADGRPAEVPDGSSPSLTDLLLRSASTNSSNRRSYHPTRPTDGATSNGSRRLYRCHICPKTCNRKFNLTQHMLTHNPFRETHVCLLCQRVYQRKGELVRHQKKAHDGR